VHPWYDLTVDGSIYIVTARSIAAGEGYTYLGEPFRVRPPGFPALLAPLVTLAGTNFFALNFAIALFGAAGVLLLFELQRPRLGFWLALLTALAVWLNPGYQRLTTQIMSDVPGATLLLLCLLVERWASRSPSPRREVVLGLCIGLSAHVRMLTVLLVPAIALSRLLARRSQPEPEAWPRFGLRRLAIFAGVTLLVLLPWSIRNQLDPAPAPAEQTLVYSYGVGMWRVDPTDPSSPLRTPAEIVSRMPLRSRQLASVLGSRMRNEERANLGEVDEAGFEKLGLELATGARPTPLASSFPIALVFLGSSLVVLVRRREPAEFFVVGSVLVVEIYFGFGGRLVLPIYLLTFPAAVEVGRDLVARLAGARAATAAATAGVLLLVASDFAPRLGWKEIERRHREMVELSLAVERSVPPDARLGAVIGAHFEVFLERPVYSLQLAARRTGSLEAAERVIEKHRIDTIVLSERMLIELAFAGYFERRYGPPERVGPALIWRVRDRKARP
jgi:4-amino-4-deoxy-L-arabinose transferase-like glycosyltransferase